MLSHDQVNSSKKNTLLNTLQKFINLIRIYKLMLIKYLCNVNVDRI